MSSTEISNLVGTSLGNSATEKALCRISSALFASDVWSFGSISLVVRGEEITRTLTSTEALVMHTASCRKTSIPVICSSWSNETTAFQHE